MRMPVGGIDWAVCQSWEPVPTIKIRCEIEVHHKKIIKEYIKESVAYLNVGIWIGAGVGVGLLAAIAILL